MGLFNALKKAFCISSAQQAGETDKAARKEENHRIAGTSYRQEAIKSLGTPNPDYALPKGQLIKKGLVNVPVYEYNFNPYEAELIPEPTNEHDPNAIKVIVSGQHVGYIKRGSCGHVKKLLKTNSIKSITAFIKGGNNKYIICNDPPGERDKDSYEFESDKGTIGVEITIKIE